jgi:acyl carrier protein
MNEIQKQKILEIFSQMFSVKVDKINLNKKIIDQFDVDSLDIAEIIVDIEDKLDLLLTPFEEKFSMEERVQMTVQEFMDNVIKESIKYGN